MASNGFAWRHMPAVESGSANSCTQAHATAGNGVQLFPALPFPQNCYSTFTKTLNQNGYGLKHKPTTK